LLRKDHAFLEVWKKYLHSNQKHWKFGSCAFSCNKKLWENVSGNNTNLRFCLRINCFTSSRITYSINKGTHRQQKPYSGSIIKKIYVQNNSSKTKEIFRVPRTSIGYVYWPLHVWRSKKLFTMLWYVQLLLIYSWLFFTIRSKELKIYLNYVPETCGNSCFVFIPIFWCGL